MAILKKLSLGVSVAALAALAPVAAVHAQVTASELRGFVTDAAGQPLSGAQVTILHTPTGTANRSTTGANGGFFQSGLRPGGPYSIIISAPGFEGEAIDGLSLAPGTQPPLRIALSSATDVITVTGQAISGIDLNSGVGSSYTSRDIANQPSIARDVISTLARDPLAASSGPNNLSVAGVNARFNGVTIDGARQQDAFGLGSNTFATARSPINIDIIESVSLVASDYSVTSSGFTGGLVNVTTRGGSNEIDGSAFYFRRTDSLVGSSTFGGQSSFNPGEFKEEEYGLSIRGPIIQDRLFFSASYDRFKTARLIDFSGNDANDGLAPGFFDTLNQMVQNTYGIDMGGRPQQSAVPEETERYFLRLDWHINDDHRLQLGYQRSEDAGVSNVASRNFSSAWYDTPTVLESYTAQLFSDWTPNLSTTIRASYIDFERGQNCRAAPGVGALEFTLNAANVAGTPLAGMITNTGNITFTGGCDRFRHANEYADERFTLFAQADYVWNDVIFTFGGEFESFDVFNLFVERSLGRFRFQGATAGQDILDQNATVEFRNVPSLNTREGAAEWGFNRWTGFAQARWQTTPTLELAAGLRYERVSTSDRPVLDPTFQQEVGIPNTTTTDGLDLLMPRVSFRWDALDRTSVSGGFGLFSGGDPAVWTSNAFQVPAVFAGGNFTGVTGQDVPAALQNAVAGGTAFAIDAVAPDFSLPSDWKASVRVDHEFDIEFGGFNLGRNYVATAQILYTASKDTFLWRDFNQTANANALPTGTAPDGRTIYADINALAGFGGIPGLSANRTVLVNGSGDESWVFSASLANEFDNGFGFYVSYAYQDIEFVSEGTSSRGISSFRGITAIDRNFPEVRNSLFEVAHSFKIGLSYEQDFIRDLTTRIDVFGQISSGSPYTFTFDTPNNNALFGRTGFGENPFNNSPLYIPTQGDSRVVYASGFDQAGFNNLIDARGIERGAIHAVNSARSAWNQRWDLRIQQDLPGIPGVNRFVGDNRFKIVFDVENFLNLINDNWGTQFNGPSNGQSPIVRADLVSAADVAANGVDGATALTGDSARTTCMAASDCVFRYNTFFDRDTSVGSNSASVWRARIGIRYEF